MRDVGSVPINEDCDYFNKLSTKFNCMNALSLDEFLGDIGSF